MIGRKIIVQFLGVGFSSLLGLLNLMITARLFGPSVIGEVNYLLGILGIILLFSDFGFSRAHVKFVADKRKISEKICIYLSVKTVLLLFFVLLSGLYFYFYLRHASSSYETAAFLILLLYELLNRFGSSILLTFEGLQLVAIQNLVLNIGKIVKLAAVFIFMFIAKNLIGLSLTYFLEGLVVFFLALFVGRRFLPLAWNKNVFRKYYKYSLPFFVIYPLSYIQSNLDVVLLRNFWTASVVGIYSVTIGLTAFLKTLNGVLITLFFPRVSQLFAKKDIKKIQQYTDLSVKYLLVIFVPIFLTLWLLRYDIIILLLGSEFKPSAEIFPLALLGVLILMISSPYDHVIYAGGKHKILAPLSFVTLLLLVLLQLILVPKFFLGLTMLGMGAKGTLIANNIAWFISAVVNISLVYLFFKVKPLFKGLWIIFFATLSLSLASFLRIESLPIFTKVIFLSAIYITFWIFLRFSKILLSSDIKYFKLLLNPKKIVKEGRMDFLQNDRK